MQLNNFFLLLAFIGFSSTQGAQWEYAGENVVGTILLGVAFTDENNGLTSGGDNGSGAMILKTSDGGKTWKNSVIDPAMMFLGIAANKDKAASMGMFSNQYSTDSGETFQTSKSKCLVSQNLEYSVQDDFFGAVGTFVKGQVAISSDGSKWDEFDLTDALEEGAFPRYGAFVDKNTWYITAGTWPMSNETDPTVTLTSRLGVDSTSSSRSTLKMKTKNNFDLITSTKRNLRSEDADDEGETGTYMNQVLKTTDGGKTWTSVYKQNGENYPNGIHCYDANTCAFVAESSDDSAKPGVSIYYTADGGNNWKEVMYLQSGSMSLMQVRMVSATEFHAVGGNLDNHDFGTLHFHTTDAGQKFEQIDSLRGTYLNSLQFVNEGLAYGSAFTKAGQSTVLKYN